jgi:hypothetical protein
VGRIQALGYPLKNWHLVSSLCIFFLFSASSALIFKLFLTS